MYYKDQKDFKYQLMYWMAWLLPQGNIINTLYNVWYKI